jgi:hypothetical protein
VTNTCRCRRASGLVQVFTFTANAACSSKSLREAPAFRHL